ncbi:MAG: hypothetical protein IK119_09670, partial [Bacteroidales bacterium]|nr:hypothetical protein [Bacteroidales bacterium]
IGAAGKPVVIKRNIFARNAQSHKELTPEQSRQILKDALYNTKLYGQNQKTSRPFNWVVISSVDIDGDHRLVLLEVNNNKDNVEIVHWHYVREGSLETIKRQAEREGGHILILPSETSEEAGGLAGRTLDSSSENKDTENSEENKESGEKTASEEAVDEHPEGTEVPGGELTEAQKNMLGFVQGKTPEQVEAEYKAQQKAKEKEAKRQEKLRKRADKWKKFLGEAFELLTSEEDIMSMQESEENRAAALAEVRNGGHGWYSPANDKAYIYLPNVKDTKQLDQKILHEVLTHKGLLHLMGREGYNRFLDSIWEKMSDSQRQWALDYYSGNQFASEKERQRAGTDEFLAAVAEENESIISMVDNNFWKNALEKLKQILNDMAGEDLFTSTAKETWLDEELMLSFVNLASERRKAEAEQAKHQDLIESMSGGAPTKEQSTGAVEKNPQMPVASSQEKYEDFGEKIGMARKDTAKKGIKKKDADGRPAWAKKYNTSNIVELSEHEQEMMAKLGGGRRNFQEVINDISKGTDFSKPFVGFYDQVIKSRFGNRTRRHYITDANGRPLIFTSQEQFEATMPVFEAKDQGYRIRENKGKFQIVRPASNGKLVEYAEFDTKEDAVAYLSSPEGATELLNRKRENYELPALEKITRTGMPDYRGGKNVTPDDILNTFGFRGGEFGNWLNAEERQQFLNYAYDAFMDLANLLGISPKALSLGGELSIAFGARGKGSTTAGSHVTAHYEPGRAVINLTKLFGAGSLAHEWAHALDNYFGLQDSKRVRDREDKKGQNEVFLTEGTSYMKGTRKEVRDAVREVMNVLRSKTVTRAIELEEAEAKLARDRSWYEREKKANRDRLEKGRTTYKYNRKTKQYDTVTYKLTDEQLAEFDRLIGQLETDPTFKWEYDFAKGGFRASGEVADKLYELIKDVMPNKKETYGPLNDLFYNLYRRVLPSSQRVNEAKEGKSETVVAETDFYKDSKWFD